MIETTLNEKKDDAELIFNLKDTSDDLLRVYDNRNIAKYRVKTIKSGNVLECEIYPIWETRSSLRVKAFRESRETQKKLNKKNAVKKFTRLINTNFTDKDIWGTVTYDDARLPATMELAQKEMVKFMRRLKYYAERHSYPQLKYAYVTEFEDDVEKETKRVHHHFVINFPDRDIAESLWRNGARTQTRRLQADDDGYEGMCRYILKDPRGTKRYVTSKNLEKPKITTADCKITRRKVRQIVLGEITPQVVFERMYAGWKYTKSYTRQSEYVSGAYIYAKLTPKRQNAKGVKRKNEIHRE